MRRAAQTAAYLSEQARPLPAFRELDMGQWEGLTFDAIRRRFPEEYARRGEDPARYPPPGGESLAAAAARAAEGLRALLADTEGDLAVVAHAGVIRLLLCRRGRRAAGRVPSAFPCPMAVTMSSPGTARISAQRKRPAGRPPARSAETCRALLRAAGAPGAVADHCAAAADLARALCAKVGGNGDLAFRAAALHDIAKGCPDHPRAGGGLAPRRRLGRPRRTSWPGTRTWGRTPPPKRKPCIWPTNCCGARSASPLAARFAASLEKCTTPEARAATVERCVAEAFRLAAEFHLQETAPENSC